MTQESYRPNLRSGKVVFFLDYYSYCCVEMNCRKAQKALRVNNKDEEEGWKALLLHYIDVLTTLSLEKPEAQYIVPSDYIKQLNDISDESDIYVSGFCVYHILPTLESFKDLIECFIKVASYIKTILVQCYDIKVDIKQLDRDIEAIEDKSRRTYDAKNRGLKKMLE